MKRMCTHEYYRTGGISSRDMAVMNSDRRWLYAEPCGQNEWFAGGPLDAPYRLPAGAMDSTSMVDGRGNPLPAEQSVLRG